MSKCANRNGEAYSTRIDTARLGSEYRINKDASPATRRVGTNNLIVLPRANERNGIAFKRGGEKVKKKIVEIISKFLRLHKRNVHSSGHTSPALLD